MLARLPGATAAAERLAARDLVARLNRFYEIATRAVITRDGTVDKLLGDEVVAFFGTPYHEADHAMRAVDAAIDIVRSMEDLASETSPVAAAVGTGDAFVGNVGEGTTRDYTAIGVTVNETADLLAHARPGEILVLPRTYAEVEARHPAAPVRTIERDAGAISVRAIAVGQGQSRGEARRVLATILFLDLVGSTDIAARIGDAAWRELLARHYALLRDLLRKHEGSEVDTAGDGLLATFSVPVHAVRFAHAAVAADAALDLEPRVGIHTGEVEREDGLIRGIGVVIAARIAAQAGARQVLVSSTVRELAEGAGIGFEDRGIRTLKGVPEPRQVYEAVAIGDRTIAERG